MLAAVPATVLVYAAWVLAYIPATSTNTTNAVNQTNISQLAMKWSAGTYSSIVSYQLAESNRIMGSHQGVLVHFSELHLKNDKPNMPWIALINCDANKTDNSQVDDIFTLARDRGAVAVLLYSNMSETCLVNPGYSNPGNFEHTLDIFTTQTKSSARLMLSQFSHLRNISFMNYDSTLSNSAIQTANDSLTSNDVSSGFMVATLRAANILIAINGSETGNSSSSPPSFAQKPNSDLAMIILYAITGCITTLFIAVMISGVLRAIRHPERYGPRAPAVNELGGYTHGQTRTAGLGQAILDTFPLMKFGQITGSPLEGRTDVKNPPCIHSEEVEGKEGDRMYTASTSVPTSMGLRFADSSNDVNESSSSPKCPSYSCSPSSRLADVHAKAIGRETCPICIDDFEAEDDIRVLPCEGGHRFHQACVDHWLLDLSSSCPLCREDFHARELLLSETDETEGVAPRQDTGISPIARRSARISRYPRFASWCNRDTQVLASAEDSGDLAIQPFPGFELA